MAVRDRGLIETSARTTALHPTSQGVTRRRGAARSTVAGSSLVVLIGFAQAFLLIPLCLDRLGSRLYGAWLGGAELLAWIQLLDLGIPNLMMQRIGAALGRGDTGEGGRWFASGLAVMLALAVVLALLGFGGSTWVAEWADVLPAQAALFEDCFRAAVVASALLLLNNAFVGLSRAAQQTALVNGTLVGGAVVGFAVSLALLLAGVGLWALAWGLLARAVVSLGGGLAFFLAPERAPLRVQVRPSVPVLREMRALAPSMSGASVGYLAVAYSELALVTTLLGPTAAAVYGLTRRAVDAARSLLDTIANAVYGGFAHLLGSEDRERAPAVLREILLARWACACLAAACVAAVNRGFVTLLFGPEHWGGFWLSLAFAVQLVISGQSFLVNYLYRAAGAVREGSILLSAWAALHLLATVLALKLVGMVGGPAAGTLVAAGLLLLTTKRLQAALPGRGSPAAPADRRLAWVTGAVVCVGALLGGIGGAPSWPSLAAVGALFLAAGGGALLWLHPPLRKMLAGVMGG